MGDNTHGMTVHGIDSYDSAQVSVPASVQREQGICIDDTVEVTIHDVSSLIDQASFENPQTAGDRVTIPADVVRQLGLVHGDVYDFSFEKVASDCDDDPDDDAGAEPGVEDDGEEDTDSAIEELFSDDEDDESDDDESALEEEDEGLGELFG